MSHKLAEAVRLAERAICGSPWTGGLDKHEVGRAVRRLISVAESLQQECATLRTEIVKQRSMKRRSR